MLLASALIALLLGGFWLYCLTDAILTPATECRGMPKPAWIAVIAATFIGGAVAWLIVRQPARSAAARYGATPRWDLDAVIDEGDFPAGEGWTEADDAVARHPAGRTRPFGAPKGPDDDPEFLRALERAIRGNSGAGEEV